MAKPEDFIHLPEMGTPAVYVQYKGILDLQGLYEAIADFFRQKKFKFYEKQHRLRRMSPFGTELNYQFEARRKVEDYYEWVVYVNIETFDTRDIEVVLKDGKKKKMTKGRIWEKNAFLAHLKSFYNKYIVKKKFEGVWWDELYYKIVLKLHALIKERLKMASEGYETRHMGGVH